MRVPMGYWADVEDSRARACERARECVMSDDGPRPVTGASRGNGVTDSLLTWCARVFLSW